MQRITSRDNPRLKSAARLLASARERRKSGRCVLEGSHLAEVYAQRYGAPETLIVAEHALEDSVASALLRQMPAGHAIVVTDAAWSAFAQLPLATAMLAIIEAPHPQLASPADFCLLLEDVQDPGNVGSIIRSAAAAGVAQVLLSPQCAFAWSPKTLRAAQGGHFHLDIFEDVDLAAWATGYGGAVVAAVASGGISLFDADLTGPAALAIGNEGSGLSHALHAAARIAVTIPMPGGFESLNAASAAAICLFERVRQLRAGR